MQRAIRTFNRSIKMTSKRVFGYCQAVLTLSLLMTVGCSPATQENTTANRTNRPQPNDSIRQLSVEGAHEVLDAHAGGDLFLNGLREITPEVAAVICSRFQGEMHFDGLQTIDSETAKVFAKSIAKISLGLTELPPDVAAELSYKTGGGLNLNQLAELPVESARELGYAKMSWLGLDGLVTIDPKAARELANFEGAWLHLNGLNHLDERTLAALAHYRGSWLYMNGASSVDRVAADRFGEIRARSLYLGGLTQLDVPTLEGLAKFEGNLFLHGLKEVSPEGCATLGSGRCRGLNLSGLDALDQECALHLGRFRGRSLELNGVKTLDIDSAKYIGRTTASLELERLDELSVNAARQLLLARPRGAYTRIELPKLDGDLAKAFVDFGSPSVHLNILEEPTNRVGNLIVDASKITFKVNLRDYIKRRDSQAKSNATNSQNPAASNPSQFSSFRDLPKLEESNTRTMRSFERIWSAGEQTLHSYPSGYEKALVLQYSQYVSELTPKRTAFVRIRDEVHPRFKYLLYHTLVASAKTRRNFVEGDDLLLPEDIESRGTALMKVFHEKFADDIRSIIND